MKYDVNMVCAVLGITRRAATNKFKGINQYKEVELSKLKNALNVSYDELYEIIAIARKREYGYYDTDEAYYEMKYK